MTGTNFQSYVGRGVDTNGNVLDNEFLAECFSGANCVSLLYRVAGQLDSLRKILSTDYRQSEMPEAGGQEGGNSKCVVRQAVLGDRIFADGIRIPFGETDFFLIARILRIPLTDVYRPNKAGDYEPLRDINGYIKGGTHTIDPITSDIFIPLRTIMSKNVDVKLDNIDKILTEQRDLFKKACEGILKIAKERNLNLKVEPGTIDEEAAKKSAGHSALHHSHVRTWDRDLVFVLNGEEENLTQLDALLVKEFGFPKINRYHHGYASSPFYPAHGTPTYTRLVYFWENIGDSSLQKIAALAENRAAAESGDSVDPLVGMAPS